MKKEAGKKTERGKKNLPSQQNVCRRVAHNVPRHPNSGSRRPSLAADQKALEEDNAHKFGSWEDVGGTRGSRGMRSAQGRGWCVREKGGGEKEIR